MRSVLQRVARASVTVDEVTVAEIGRGLLVLVGVSARDTVADADATAVKLAGLRVFPDEAGAMNRSAIAVGAEVLVVSQFTLCADVRRGRRPSFSGAARPEEAAPLVAAVAEGLRKTGLQVAEGSFGAMMAVELVNDGPVTIIVETSEGRLV
jgi:D-aminoacyl-tRNA deacylase